MVELFQTKLTLELLPKYQKFLTDFIYPIELDVLTKPFRQSLQLLTSLREKAKAQHLFAPHLSVDEGGLGLSLVEFAQVSEILGTSPLGHYIFNCNAPDIGNMELMHQFASMKLKEKYLPPLQQRKISILVSP